MTKLAVARTWSTPVLARIPWQSVRGFALPLALLVLWTLVVQFELVNTRILVSPEAVLRFFEKDLASRNLTHALLASLTRDALGFSLGSTAGIVFGALLGMSRFSERLFGPSFHGLRQVALFAWIPLISVWFGTGEPAKIVFIALSAFYPVVINTHEGVRGVAKEHLEVARAFEFTTLQAVRRVILPSALPSMCAGLQLALAYAWLGTIGAEYLLAPGPGIGNLMIEGREQLAMDKVLTGVIVVGVVGALINALAHKVERKLVHWRIDAFDSRS